MDMKPAIPSFITSPSADKHTLVPLASSSLVLCPRGPSGTLETKDQKVWQKFTGSHLHTGREKRFMGWVWLYDGLSLNCCTQCSSTQIIKRKAIKNLLRRLFLCHILPVRDVQHPLDVDTYPRPAYLQCTVVTFCCWQCVLQHCVF